MQREFLASGSAKDLKIFYLNGSAQMEDPEIPAELDPGVSFSADGITLRVVMAYMGRRAWSLETSRFTVLFPNGIPPARILSAEGVRPISPDLVVLGKRDNRDLSETYLADQKKPRPCWIGALIMRKRSCHSVPTG